MCVVVWSGGPENCQQSALASVLSEVPHSLFWSIHHMKKVKAPSSKARELNKMGLPPVPRVLTGGGRGRELPVPGNCLAGTNTQALPWAALG